MLEHETIIRLAAQPVGYDPYGDVPEPFDFDGDDEL